MRRAADTMPDDERRSMLERADRIKATADDLKARLVSIIEGVPRRRPGKKRAGKSKRA